MPSAQDYENSIINQLMVTDPSLSTGLGTPVRKIISAVAMAISNYVTDQEVTNTLYSIDAVSGADLDYLVAQFGFTRQEARAAHGTLVISRDNADAPMQIAYGSQFYKPATSTTPQIVFQTTTYQELAEGVLSAEVAVIALSPGAQGNVPADTITYSTTYGGYIAVTNDNPTTGGRDRETDEELRKRFLNTVFRNLAGTQDQYMGLALAHTANQRASVVGRASHYSEIVQAKFDPDEDKVYASVSKDRWNAEVAELIDVQHRYWVKTTDGDVFVGRGEFEVDDSGQGVWFHRKMENELIGPVTLGDSLTLMHGYISDLEVVDNIEEVVGEVGKDYIVDEIAGVISIPATTAFGTGNSLRCTYRYQPILEDEFLTIEFDYLSKINRGELKSAELLIDGVEPQHVNDIEYIDFSKRITAQNRSQWLREDNSRPIQGHVYIPLSYQPLYASSGQLNVGTSTILREGKHFVMLYDQTKRRGSSRGADAVELLGDVKEVNGRMVIELDDKAQPGMPDETPVNVPYYYNEVVGTVQDLVDVQSVVTMDCMVHEVRRRYFGIYLTMMFSTFPKEEVKNAVKEAVIAWANNLPFGAPIQFSDIETVAANTAGVDNVRVSLQKDAANRKCDFEVAAGQEKVGAYGIIECARDGKTFVEQYTTDFQLTEQDAFEVEFVEIYARTAQGW